MNTPSAHGLGIRLLRLPDAHGAPLADYDYFATLDLLLIHWRGHLTAETFMHGARVGMQLFEGHPLPRRLLSNHAQVTGEWAEALPWLHYEWLPQASAGGVRALAHVLAQNTASHLINYYGGPEFIAAVTQSIQAVSFRHLAPAWQWLTRR